MRMRNNNYVVYKIELSDGQKSKILELNDTRGISKIYDYCSENFRSCIKCMCCLPFYSLGPLVTAYYLCGYVCCEDWSLCGVTATDFYTKSDLWKLAICYGAVAIFHKNFVKGSCWHPVFEEITIEKTFFKCRIDIPEAQGSDSKVVYFIGLADHESNYREHGLKLSTEEGASVLCFRDSRTALKVCADLNSSPKLNSYNEGIVVTKQPHAETEWVTAVIQNP